MDIHQSSEINQEINNHEISDGRMNWSNRNCRVGKTNQEFDVLIPTGLAGADLGHGQWA